MDHIDKVDMIEFDTYVAEKIFSMSLEDFYELIFPNRFY